MINWMKENALFRYFNSKITDYQYMSYFTWGIFSECSHIELKIIKKDRLIGRQVINSSCLLLGSGNGQNHASINSLQL